MTAEIKKHWNRVSGLGCLITGDTTQVTLHHAHGGSMLSVPGFTNPGMGQKANDWLVVPITAELHTGRFGIDHGQGQIKSVAQWEKHWGRTQVELLDEVCDRLGYDVWAKAGIER